VNSRKRRALLGALVATAAAVAAAAALGNAVTGPSSSQSPYVVRSQPGVVTKAILTVGDSVGGYRMVGIPDGLGAFDNGDGTFTVLMNHELRPGTGVTRAHGSNGAFVSKWTIDKDTLQVTNPNVFYFVTTNAIDAPSRLWRMTFADVRNPAAGGRTEMLLDGTEGQLMMDNITVDDRGNVLIQEDVGGNAHIGKIFKYFSDSDTLNEVAHHDENRFAPGAPNFLTIDEESSGIIPAPFLGEGWYLLDVQAHYATDAETVEGGQLLALHVPPGRKK
jgi:hypothetical protein